MYIDGEEIEVEKVREEITDEDRICKCGHSLERHRKSNSSKNFICIERYCPCSNFRLNNIK